MRYTAPWLIVLALVVLPLTGCGGVTTRHLIGDRVASERAAELMEGVWAAPDGNVLHIVGEGDVLRIGHLAWDEGRFVVHELVGVLSESGEASYLHVRSPEEAEAGYGFLRVTFVPQEQPTQMVLYGSRIEPFRDAVEQGRLAGEIERHNDEAGGRFSFVHLHAESAELAAYIKPEDVGRLFDMENPVVLRRLGSPRE